MYLYRCILFLLHFWLKFQNLQCNSTVCDFYLKFIKFAKLLDNLRLKKCYLYNITGTPRRYCCKLCPFKTAYASSLKTHELTHTQERPYWCPHCSRSYNHKSNLKAHLRIHTGEKPFSCGICCRRFSFQSSYKKHLLVHYMKNWLLRFMFYNSIFSFQF